TDAEEVIQKRLDKADFELSFAPQFDIRIVNEDLDRAVKEVRRIIQNA
ncbi:MAG: guanylate kinase, partial [Muribaculaceae bacterium]|nr:guanylate kinase [Muribaculaceae bacterium]